MSFLFPALLGGLGAVAVPVAIHLLNKFRVRTVDWGAMRFLLESLRKNERRVKVEDLILLILRCLLVTALVLAFARPVLRGLVTGDADSGPVAAVLLLDQSASMSQNDGVTTRFDDGKRAILQWLEGRDPQSLVGLLLVSNRVDPVIPVPQPDFALIRKTLELVHPSNRGTDLAPGIRLAYQVLKNTAGRNREIRVYTDDQSCAWSKLDDIRQLQRDNPEISLLPVILGRRGENNLGVVDLRADGGIPAARQPCRVRVDVANYGEQPATESHVTFSVDGASPTGDVLIPAIAPGSTQTANFVVSFPSAGPHTVTASIPADAFPADNQRTLPMNVVRRVSVLIVEGGPAASTLDRDGFFLANALQPLPRAQTARSYLELKYAVPEQLDAATLDGVGTVFLCNPGAIPDAPTHSLKSYVEAGGNLVVFPGPRTNLTQWNQNSAWTDLLPATLGPASDAPDAKNLLAWQPSDFEHPVMALWNDPAQGSVGSVRTSRRYPLILKPATAQARPAVIVRYSGGEPAAVEWEVGKGRVALFSSTVTPEWNNLPLHPAFVPFVQRLMGYLHRNNDTVLALSPGDLFVKEVPSGWSGRDFSVQRPGGESAPPVAGQISSEDGRAFLRYSATDALGAYRIFVGGELSAAFAVQLDPAESDLRQLDPARLASLSEPSPRTATPTAGPRLVVTHEFWLTLLIAGAVLAVLESTLAHRFSRSR